MANNGMSVETIFASKSMRDYRVKHSAYKDRIFCGRIGKGHNRMSVVRSMRHNMDWEEISIAQPSDDIRRPVDIGRQLNFAFQHKESTSLIVVQALQNYTNYGGKPQPGRFNAMCRVVQIVDNGRQAAELLLTNGDSYFTW